MLKINLRSFRIMAGALIIMLLVANTVYAFEKKPGEYTNKEILNENMQYSYVMDKVNEKYDADISMMSQEELKELDHEGFELELIEDAKVYEKELIDALIESEKSSEEAQAEWDSNPAKPEFEGYMPCENTSNSIAPKASRTREQSKKYTNFWSNINAVGVNTQNYWQFQSIKKAWTSVSYNKSPYFRGQSWTWKKKDSGITAQINYKGYTYLLNGNVVKRGVSKTTTHSAGLFNKS